MRASVTGLGFLFGYIVLVGTASFLEKFSMKQLNPYQVNFLMAIGMAVTAVPALWIKQGSLTVPTKALPLGAPIGLLMALALWGVHRARLRTRSIAVREERSRLAREIHDSLLQGFGGIALQLHAAACSNVAVGAAVTNKVIV